MFCVDEVVVFDDAQSGKKSRGGDGGRNEGYGYASGGGTDNYYTGYSDPNHFLIHILSYLETPPHLRKALFPMHPNLQLAGALPSLDMPHHLRAHEWCRYREGITVESTGPMNGSGEVVEEQEKRKKKKKKGTREEKSTSNTVPVVTYVETGLPHKVAVPTSIPPNARVTLKFSDEASSSNINDASLTAAAAAPSAPREEAGYYWGYSVRCAPSISTVLTECPFDGGYDVTFGTSERGTPLSALIHPAAGSDLSSPIPEFCHLLIVFGGVAGLEVAVTADQELAGLGVMEPKDLFDYWVNLCPGQGSRTIRTEEAVWLGLMGLREVVVGKGRS